MKKGIIITTIALFLLTITPLVHAGTVEVDIVDKGAVVAKIQTDKDGFVATQNDHGKTSTKSSRKRSTRNHTRRALQGTGGSEPGMF